VVAPDARELPAGQPFDGGRLADAGSAEDEEERWLGQDGYFRR
jgi:hypothetical protein